MLRLVRSVVAVQPVSPSARIQPVGRRQSQERLVKKKRQRKLDQRRSSGQQQHQGRSVMKKPGPNQKGLKKLPTAVRNKMGYMNKGGMAAPKFKTCPGCPTPAKCTAAGKCAKESGYYGGGMAKKKTGYNKGGYVNCGASMKPAQKKGKK